MQINYGDIKIEFKVKYKKRENIKISVKPDLSVEVLAPIGVTDYLINKIILKRANWILKQKFYFNQFLPRVTPRLYVSGETHRYLGRQYRLKVIAAMNNDVKLKGRFFYIHTINKYDREYNKKLFYKWCKIHAENKFNELFEICYEKLKKYNIKKPSWSIRKMKLRWGSYSPKTNNILFNIELIKVSTYCIQYVIMHELCHVRYPNHSNEFYRFLDLVMPDWEKRKDKLEKFEI